MYFRLNEVEQYLINQRVFEGVVTDIGESEKIIGIEILDASKHLNIEKLLPVEYEAAV